MQCVWEGTKDTFKESVGKQASEGVIQFSINQLNICMF